MTRRQTRHIYLTCLFVFMIKLNLTLLKIQFISIQTQCLKLWIVASTFEIRNTVHCRLQEIAFRIIGPSTDALTVDCLLHQEMARCDIPRLTSRSNTISCLEQSGMWNFTFRLLYRPGSYRAVTAPDLWKLSRAGGSDSTLKPGTYGFLSTALG